MLHVYQRVESTDKTKTEFFASWIIINIYIYIHIYIYYCLCKSNNHSLKSAQYNSVIILWEEDDAK